MSTFGFQRAARVAIAVVVASAVIPAAALGVAGDFTQPATSPEPVGAFPGSVAAANLNGDARPDLAVATGSGVAILLGDGIGDFTPPATSPEPAGSGPEAVVAANLGGTASTDLAVVNPALGGVTILLGDGSGNFTEKAGTSPEDVGDFPISAATGNLNGDANIDLAVINADTEDVTILLGSSSGDFTAAGAPESAGAGPASVVIANLNGDANADLAVANTDSDDVTILLGDGAGDFAEVPTTSPEMAGTEPSSVTAANFNGDANTDLAVANLTSDDVTILLGDGTGNFAAAGMSPETAGDNPRSVVAADLGGSTSADLAVANAFSDNVSILLGDGSGNFTPAGSSPEPVGDFPTSLTTADLDGDTRIDLAVANLNSSNATVLLNEFLPAAVPPILVPTGPQPTLVPTDPPPTQRKCKKGQKLKKGKCVKKKRKKKR